MSYIARVSRYMQRTFPPRTRKFIILGLIGVIVVYFMVIIGIRGTFEQGQTDWGIDQGYTQLFWGLVAILCLGAVLSYPIVKKRVKSPALDRLYYVIFSTGFFFIFLFIVTFQFWTHDQYINFYHRMFGLDELFGKDNWNLIFVDKIGHFVASAIIVIFLLYVFPRKEWVLIAWAFVNLFELFEIMVIYNLYVAGSAQHTLETMLYEIGDVTWDVILNTLGVLVGYYVATKVPYINKRLR